jgi:hypothetical protein
MRSMVRGAGRDSKPEMSEASVGVRHLLLNKLRETARRCEASRSAVSASERNEDE